MAHLVEVAFKGNRKEFFLWDYPDPPPLNAAVIVDVDRGEDLGYIHSLGDLAQKRNGGCSHGCGTSLPERKRRKRRPVIELAHWSRPQPFAKQVRSWWRVDLHQDSGKVFTHRHPTTSIPRSGSRPRVAQPNAFPWQGDCTRGSQGNATTPVTTFAAYWSTIDCLDQELDSPSAILKRPPAQSHHLPHLSNSLCHGILCYVRRFPENYLL